MHVCIKLMPHVTMREALRLNQLSENARQILFLLWFETSQSQSISTSCSLSSSLGILYVLVTVSQKRKSAGLFFFVVVGVLVL